MEKRLIFTVSSKEFRDTVSPLTHPTIAAYARKVGATFLSYEMDDKEPEKAKILISHYLKSYDRVLYLDSDIIIRPDSPDIFDIVPEEELGLLYESRFIPKTRNISQILLMLGVQEKDMIGKAYGFGVIVASKSHAKVFENTDLMSAYDDDTALNVSLNLVKPLIFELPYKFNYQHFMDRITGEDRLSAYFVHYSGAAKKIGLEALSQVILKDMKSWAVDAPEYKYQKNIGIIVGGGLGDQIAAEPTVRYAVENLFKGDNIAIACNWPEIFSHINAPAYIHGDKNIPPRSWFEIYTLRSPEHLIWNHVSHTLTNATDYAAISALRMQLPLESRQIKLPKDKAAKADVLKKLNGANPKKLIVVHPGKGWKTKTFPSWIWQSYLDILTNNDFTVAVVGKTINETQGLVEVDALNCIDLRDKLKITELIELIRMCGALLTNDSSPIHIAGDSDCWIGVIATCKHPDYILPYRKGSVRYKAVNLEASPLYYDFDRRPSSIDGSTIDQCEDARLLECLPGTDKILEFAKKAIKK